ncbi:MAG: hypothetical protein KAT68_17450 [Bacteroidales bacterium]|nr:hypothetical protein [Bacteroidales bacterium]
MIQFNKIINILGWIICNLGVIYFLIRMIYFSAKTSLHVEIKEIIAFKYFLPIHITEEDGEKEKRMKKILNIMLKSFYILLGTMLFIAMIKVFYAEMQKIR